MRRLALILLVAALGACGDNDETAAPEETTTTAPAATCSAAEVAEPGDQEQLPGSVAETRTRIVDLARACDFDGLAALAMEGDFTYSFGGGEDPATFWREAEDAGEEPLATLVRLLGMKPVIADPVVWPGAYARQSWAEVIDEERAELLEIYSEEELKQFESFGSYAGYRVGINSDGDWIFFVAGD